MIWLIATCLAQPVMEEWSFEPEPLYTLTSYPGLVSLSMPSGYAALNLETGQLQLGTWSIEAWEARAMDLGPYWGYRHAHAALTEPGVDSLQDITTGEVIIENDDGHVVPDIDGDGLPDVHGDLFVHLQRGAAWLATDYPPFESAWNYYRHLPVGDLTGDGRGDLLIADDTDWVPWRGFAMFQGGHLELYAGTDDGYAPEPTWTLDVDAPIADAVAMQLDDDPELELLMVGADDWIDVVTVPASAALLTVDLSSGTPVVERPYELAASYSGDTSPPSIWPLEDLDGDGLDEVLLFLSVRPDDLLKEPFPVGFCLASSAQWDPTQPLWTLDMEPGTSGHPGPAIVADVNGNGHKEAVTVFEQYSPYQTLIRVWYIVDPSEPLETGHTGETADTGTPTTTDTGTPPYVTPDDTGEPTTTTDDTTAISPSGPEPTGCGCDASPRFPLSPFARRRAGGSQ